MSRIARKPQQENPSISPAQPQVTAVIGGGGFFGAYASGAVEALGEVLQEIGFEIDEIYGTSAGALVGALYREGFIKKGMPGVTRKMDTFWDEAQLFASGLFLVDHGKEISRRVARFMNPYMPDVAEGLVSFWQTTAHQLISHLTALQFDQFGHGFVHFLGRHIDEALLADPRIPITCNITLEDGTVVTPRADKLEILAASACLDSLMPMVRTSYGLAHDGMYGGFDGTINKVVPRKVLVRISPFNAHRASQSICSSGKKLSDSSKYMAALALHHEDDCIVIDFCPPPGSRTTMGNIMHADGIPAMELRRIGRMDFKEFIRPYMPALRGQVKAEQSAYH